MFVAPILATVALTFQGTDSLTLGQALMRARTSRPRILAAAAAVERARGQSRLTTMIPNPTAQLQTDDIAPTHATTVVQPLAWLPRYFANAAAGRAGVSRAAADSAQILADVGRDVRLAFFASLAADQRLTLIGEQSAIADSLVRIADRRVSAGDISALERDQVAQEASRSRLTAWQARERARTARADFGRAIAWNTADVPPPSGLLGDGLDATPAPNDSGVLARLPALRAAIADDRAASARLQSARLAQLPLPSIIAGREWGGDPEPRRSVILGLSMPIPIWSQGREAVAEAKGAAAESAARLAEARLTLTAQLVSARIRVVETSARATFARDSLYTEARRIRVGAVRLYEAGRTGIVPMLDALRIEREIAQALVQELLAFQQARADLIALRGDWQ